MTTAAFASRIRHDSDAAFREWGSEFSTNLAACGLVQTADSGQINWATVTRAGVNSNAGYEIWRFNDAMQSTAPIYLRFDYGTGGATASPRIQVTVGTGSNGSGTITGTALSIARPFVNSNIPQTSDTVRNSYMCHTDGMFGVLWKAGTGGANEGMFLLARTVDASGVADATGALAIWANSNTFTASQAFRYEAAAAAYTANTNIARAQICVWPQTPSGSNVGADIQAALAWTITPRVQPLVGFCGVLDSEMPLGTAFTATLIGSTPRTYLALGSGYNYMDAGGFLKPAMLWE